jgi:hypothetical protein
MYQHARTVAMAAHVGAQSAPPAVIQPLTYE